MNKHRPRWLAAVEKTTTERGYGSDWQRLQRAKRRADPICQRCRHYGRTVPTSEVDHLIPFDGLDDPLRLAWWNLQSLCNDCHQRKGKTQTIDQAIREAIAWLLDDDDRESFRTLVMTGATPRAAFLQLKTEN